jgi:hypothetical protein
MAVLDLPAPEGAVRPVGAKEVRPLLEPAEQRFSSPAAHAVDTDVDGNEMADLAARMGVSERALRTAHGMLKRHLAGAGAGRAARLTAKLDGIRRAELTAPGLMVRGHTDDLRVGVALVADPLVMLAVGGAHRALHWSLLPGGPSVTSRADSLRLIRGLAAGGELRFQVGDRDPFPPLELQGGAWNDEDEWRLFEDLAALEEWSGVTIPMPRHVSAEAATIAAQAASWARSQQIDAQITDALAFGTEKDLKLGEADELRLHQDFGIDLLGADIPLGEGIARVKLRSVAPDGTEGLTYRAWPAQRDISFWLMSPPNRRLPARRTQPERLLPPGAQWPAQLRHRPAFARPARRRLSEVLGARRPHEVSAADHPKGTAGLVDDIRGK